MMVHWTWLVLGLAATASVTGWLALLLIESRIRQRAYRLRLEALAEDEARVSPAAERASHEVATCGMEPGE